MSAEAVEQSRRRRGLALGDRDRVVSVSTAVLVGAGSVALAAAGAAPAPLLAAGLVLAYAVLTRIEIEAGPGCVVPTHLAFVPMLMLLPPTAAPLLAVAGAVLGGAFGVVRTGLHAQRLLLEASSCWPALVAGTVAAVAGTEPAALAIAVGAGIAADAAHTLLAERLVLGASAGSLAEPLAWAAGLDASLALAAGALVPAAERSPAVLALLLPLAAGVALLARERAGRLTLARAVSLDALTGLANRRAWEEGLPALLDRAAKDCVPMSVALLDLDHFKRLNDTHGHAAGDALLAGAGAAWRERVRADDLLARYGGEEFALAQPGCGPDDAAALVERLRAALPEGATCSAGLAVWDGDEPAHALVARADAALYAAKAAGRDCLRAA